MITSLFAPACGWKFDGGRVKSMILGRDPNSKVLLMSADLPRFPVEWDVFNRFEAFNDALIGAERGCRVSFEPAEFIWLSLSFRLMVGREWLAILSSDRSPGDCIDLYSAFKYMKASSRSSGVLSRASFLEGADECKAEFESFEAPWLAIAPSISSEFVEVVLGGCRTM